MLMYIEHVEFMLIFIVFMGPWWRIRIHIGPMNGTLNDIWSTAEHLLAAAAEAALVSTM